MLRIEVSRWGQPLGTSDHEAGLVRIGSAPDNDLQLDLPDFAPHHLEVFLREGQPFACSPDGRPLRVGGKRVTERAPLDEHPIPIGDFAFRVSVEPAAPLEERARSTGRARLEGNALVPLPALGPDERLVLEARRILLARRAPTAQLRRLSQRGLPLAREIVEHHARQGLNGMAGEVRITAERQLAQDLAQAAANHTAARPRVGLRLLLLLIALLVFALFAWRLVDLVLSFQD